MEKIDFLLLLDELFELDDGMTRGEDVIQEIDGWSSLTLIGLIALIDREFEIQLGPESILNSRTVNELIAVLGDSITSGKQAA